MKRTLTIPWICGLLCVTVACDDTAEAPLTHVPMELIDARAEDIADTDTTENKPSLTADDAAHAEDHSHLLGNEPSAPITVRFPDLGDGIQTSKELRVELENMSQREYQVSARLDCSGLLTRSASRDIGERRLRPGDSVTLSVNPTELPIQSLTNINQCRLELNLLRDTEVGPSLLTQLFPPFNYRHSDNYTRVSIFTDRETVTTHRGRFVTTPDSPEVRGPAVLGRVFNGRSFEEVRHDDVSHRIVSKDGSAVMQLIETSMSFGIDKGTEVQK